MWVLALAGPATAMEDVYTPPSCNLYAGEETVESLQPRVEDFAELLDQLGL